MADEQPQETPNVKPPKHAGGRPPIWTDPAVLQKLIDQYFDNQQRPSLSGLAHALDIDRQTLYNYQEKDEFFGIIKNARRKVEMLYEEILLYGDKPTGVIFALKNMGWKDRSDMTTNDKDLPIQVVSYHKDNG